MSSGHESEEEYEVGKSYRLSLSRSYHIEILCLFSAESIVQTRVEEVRGEGGSKVKEWVSEISACLYV